MSSIYDVFRRVQAEKTSCHDKRSAAFIDEGLVSNDITHIRVNKVKKAALVFNHKEGPDDVIIFTYKEIPASGELQKGDYFTYDSVYYLVYEDVKQTDENLKYKKQRAVECNINFAVNQTYYNAYFMSSLRKWIDPDMQRNAAIVSNEGPVVIIPSSSVFEEGLIFNIRSKPWKIVEYDDITNYGITYLYLERSYSATTDTTALTPDTPLANTLSAMVEYTFDTKDAYFASNPRIDVIERKSATVKFMIPYGITSVSISTKNQVGVVVVTNYTVVI